MKRKSVFAVILAVAIILSSLAVGSVAFGNDTTWNYDSESRTLYIHGSSDMDDYDDQFSTPWNEYMSRIKSVVIDEGITSLGAYAFAGLVSLESVRIPSTVTAIKSYCLSSCPMLKELSFGENITSISDESFAYNGIEKKADFVVKVRANTYPLYYMINKGIDFDVDSSYCGSYRTKISVAGMKGIIPYTPKCDGRFRFYSSGGFDTIGYLYDSSFTQIGKNDDASSSNTNFSLTVNLTKGETYYFAAALFSTGMRGTFDVTLEAVSFTVDGSIVAMADRSGTPSDIPVTTALMDNTPVSDEFTIDVTGGSVTKTFTCASQSKTVTLTPDTDPVITFMMCDANNDGYVNAKDFAIMTKSDSEYLTLYPNFIDFTDA